MKRILSIIIATAIFIQVFLPVQEVKAESFEAPKYWDKIRDADWFKESKLTGIAIDSSDNIFVVDSKQEKVYKFSPAGEKLLTINVGSSFPESFTGIAIDSNNMIYVTEYFSGSVKIYDSNGVFQNSWHVGFPTAIDIDQNGDVFITTYSAEVEKFSKNGTLIKVLVSNYSASSIKIDASGGFLLSGCYYFGTSGVKGVFRFDSSGNFITSYYVENCRPSWPIFTIINGLTEFDNKIYFTERNSHQVKIVNSNGGLISTFGSYGSENGEFIRPNGIAHDSHGNIFVVDEGNSRIQKFDSNGNYLAQFRAGNGINPTFVGQSSGMSFYSGKTYIVDSSHARLNVYNENLEIVEKRKLSNYFSQPKDIAFDKYGNTYISGDNKFVKFDSENNFVYSVGNSGEGIFNGIVVGTNDIIYIAIVGWDNRIEMYSLSGRYLGRFGSFGTAEGQFIFSPNPDVGVTLHKPAVDRQNNIYIADTINNRIQKFDKDGNFIFASNLSSNDNYNGHLYRPHSIFVTDKNIYVGSLYGLGIDILDLNGNPIDNFGVGGSSGRYFEYGKVFTPMSISIDSKGKIYVTDKPHYRVDVFKYDEAPELWDVEIPSKIMEKSINIIKGVAKDDFGTVAKVEYMLNGGTVGGIGKLVGRVNAAGLGEWTICNANDGVFDQKVEEFNCEVGNLKNGNYTIYIRATDDSGHVTEVARYVIGSFNVTSTSNLSDNVSDLLATTGWKMNPFTISSIIFLIFLLNSVSKRIKLIKK